MVTCKWFGCCGIAGPGLGRLTDANSSRSKGPTPSSNQQRKYQETSRLSSQLAFENTLDVPSTVQHTNNFNRAGDTTVENDVAADGKTLNPRSQLLSLASRAGLAGKRLNRLVEFVDIGVRIRPAVIGNVAQISIRSALARGLMRSWDTYFALFADFFSRARRLIS